MPCKSHVIPRSWRDRGVKHLSSKRVASTFFLAGECHDINRDIAHWLDGCARVAQSDSHEQSRHDLTKRSGASDRNRCPFGNWGNDLTAIQTMDSNVARIESVGWFQWDMINGEIISTMTNSRSSTERRRTSTSRCGERESLRHNPPTLHLHRSFSCLACHCF